MTIHFPCLLLSSETYFKSLYRQLFFYKSIRHPCDAFHKTIFIA